MPQPVGYPAEVGEYRQLVKDFGTCLNFASGGQVSLGTGNPFSSDFYWSGWVKWNGDNGTYQHIFAKRDSYSASTMMFDLFLNTGTNKLSLDTNVGQTDFVYIFPKNVWVHLVWVHNVTDSLDQIYINGDRVFNNTIKTLGTGTTALVSIGSVEAGLSEPFNGKMDEIVIGNAAPTWAQVVAMYAKYAYPSQWSYLKFDESSGSTALDSSGNGNIGTITTATYATDKVLTTRTTVSSRPTSLPGSSLSFNGSNTSVNCGTANPGNTFSAGGWLKWAGTNGLTQTIISKRSSFSASTMMWMFYLNSTNGELRSIFAAGGGITFQSKILPLNTYNHVAFVCDGTAAANLRLYINGRFFCNASGPHSNGTGLSSPVVLGGNQSPAQEIFNGKLDEMFICDYALTENQVKSVMERNYGGIPNQWGLWKFNENSGTTAFDSAGTNTGAITNATYSTDVAFGSRSFI